MHRRFARRAGTFLNRTILAGLGLIAACFLAPVAGAVDIAPDLEAALSTKNSEDRVPVLMLFHESGHGKSALPGLGAMGPEARRRLVLESLRDRAYRDNAVTRAALAAAERRGEVTRVRELYLAGAILFEANAAVHEVGDGGAINASSGPSLLTDCVFARNTASSSGGAVQGGNRGSVGEAVGAYGLWLRVLDGEAELDLVADDEQPLGECFGEDGVLLRDD